MCGIIGFVTTTPRKNAYQRTNFLQQGLVVDSLRGANGTGIGLVNDDLEVNTFKRALSGPDFVNTSVCESAMKVLDDSIIAIGHNRAATIGTSKDKNCHPFYYKSKREILLVHNGTLNNYHSLSPASFNHEVDSAHAAMALSDADDVGSVLRKIRGPFVFVWWDGTEKTFNIARNEFRDIYFIKDKEGVLYFGSEYKMMDWLFDRNNIEFEEKAKFIFPQDHEWVSWKVEPDKLNKPKITPIIPEKEKYDPPNRRQGYVPNHGRRWDTDNDEKLKKIGILKYDRVDVAIKSIEYYNGGDNFSNPDRQYGKIIGTMMVGNKEYPVWIHTITATRFAFLNEKFGGQDKVLPARVESATIELGDTEANDKYTVICNLSVADLQEEHKATKAREQLNIYNFLQGPGGTHIPEHAWKEITKGGCAYCEKVPTTLEAKVIEWVPLSSPPNFLCSACASDPEVRSAAGMQAVEKETKQQSAGGKRVH